MDQERSLFDELVEENRKKPVTCGVGVALQKMEAKDRDSILEGFRHEDIKSSTIASVLKRRGFDVTAASVARHRRGACSCEKYIPEECLINPAPIDTLPNSLKIVGK